MTNLGWLIPIAIVFTIFGLPMLLKHAEGRRKFLLDLKKEERRIAEAKAKELELEQRRRELEYREALLELERFDRRRDHPMPPKIDQSDGGSDTDRDREA
jgi:hypothetical protein